MNKPDVGIEEEIAEIFAWCDSGAAVGFRHRKFAAQTLQALYTRLAEGAVRVVNEESSPSVIEAVPLSVIKELFGVKADR